MSILAQATQPQGGVWGELLVFAPPAVVSLVIAAFAGVFRRRSIVGPPRIADRESVGAPLIILGVGFALWIVVQVVCLAPAHPTSVAPAPSTEPAAAIVASRPVATQPATTQSVIAPADAQQDLPPGRMAIASTVPAIVAGVVMLLANAVLRPLGLTRMGLSPGVLRRGLVQGLIGGIIVVPFIFFVAEATQLLWQVIGYEHPKEHDLLRLMGQSDRLIEIVLIASAVLVAPLFEELLFRGHLQTVVTHALSRLSGRERKIDPRGFEVIVPTDAPETQARPEPPKAAVPSAAARWASVFLTSLIFASVHPAWTIPPIFVLSLCLGYAYERTGNLWTVMTMHALFNATSTVLYLFVLR
jgi:membrane protease YdiL (CAAX protease family)